jgi:hypothetical protein
MPQNSPRLDLICNNIFTKIRREGIRVSVEILGKVEKKKKKKIE